MTVRAAGRWMRLPAGEPGIAGMDEHRLRRMNAELPDRSIKDVLIVRKGELLWRWHEQGSDRIAAVYSCTKSIVSALIGMAVDDRLLQLDTPISHFFEWLHDSKDSRKAAITVRDLLTMTPGFDWPEFDKPYFKMRRTGDWIGFITSQPLVHRPGQIFAYNSGCSHLLSAILTRVTGEPAQLFAQRRLFSKLGFRSVRWARHGGISEGGAGLHLTAEDLAKFGLLYLEQGVWQGERLLSQSWIEASTKVQSRGLPHYQPPIYGEYGYHWWVSTAEHNDCCDLFFALGYGGQYLFIVPELELVVVIRKSVEGKSRAMLAKELLFDHIIPATLG
ncbi:serine hydrolase domain-containing protein [Paenibacillus sp. 1P07SE]|uniref:serine hydrolase domain-containing protein n=1 Tax=Paenibacillus sp. 1P07SE TaxID=3132209 RepID=UPI0039A45178